MVQVDQPAPHLLYLKLDVFLKFSFFIWRRRDLNPDYLAIIILQITALTIQPQHHLEHMGFEPMTFSLQVKRSTKTELMPLFFFYKKIR